MTRFFDAVVQENAGRAVRRQPPLDYDQAKKKWDRIVNASFPRTVPGSMLAMVAEKTAVREAAKKASGQQTPPRPLFKGGLVCYAFNQAAGCGRVASGSGCKEGGGGGKEFHHVCTFYDRKTSKYCYAAHSKADKTVTHR